MCGVFGDASGGQAEEVRQSATPCPQLKHRRTKHFTIVIVLHGPDTPVAYGIILDAISGLAENSRNVLDLPLLRVERSRPTRGLIDVRETCTTAEVDVQLPMAGRKRKLILPV